MTRLLATMDLFDEGNPPVPSPGLSTGRFRRPGTEATPAPDRRTAGIAHDFNNLLSVILSYASELETALSGTDLHEPASEIRAAAERGAELSRQLIGGPAPETTHATPTSVGEEIEATLATLARTAGDGIEITFRCESGLPRIALAPAQIERVLINLATNARDAMPGGGAVRIKAELVAVPPGDPVLGTGWFVRLAVADGGAGMDRETARRAAEPFFTTKLAGAGSGIGLATVQEISRSAGGDLRITSLPGAGTVVSLLLPAIRPDGSRLSLPRASAATAAA